MMSIGGNLRRLRLDREMTQEQASSRLGITRQALSGYETGRTRPDIDMLLSMAELYGTDLDGLVYGQDRCIKGRRRLKTAAILFGALIIAAVILSSALLWSANRYFPIVTGKTLSVEQSRVLDVHMRLTDAWETVDSIMLTMLSVFGIVLVIMSAVEKKDVQAWIKALYVGTLIAGIFIAPLFFAATDKVFTPINYYITPMFAGGRILIFLLISLTAGAIKKKRKQRNSV